MTSGYVLTREGNDALALFTDERVRFAAALSDGSGIVAFDGGWEALGGLALGIGTVFMAQEPHPDDPRTWPDWAREGHVIPKRRMATGREHFTLVSVSFEEYAHGLEAVTGCVRVTDDLLLVESDGPVAIGAGWTAAIDGNRYRDKRLVSV
jgi:hypothetical protein